MGRAHLSGVHISEVSNVRYLLLCRKDNEFASGVGRKDLQIFPFKNVE